MNTQEEHQNNFDSSVSSRKKKPTSPIHFIVLVTGQLPNLQMITHLARIHTHTVRSARVDGRTEAHIENHVDHVLSGRVVAPFLVLFPPVAVVHADRAGWTGRFQAELVVFYFSVRRIAPCLITTETVALAGRHKLT